MKVEGYELHLYCDECEHGYGDKDKNSVYSGRSKWTAYKYARRDGWSLGKRDLCPNCSGKAQRIEH